MRLLLCSNMYEVYFKENFFNIQRNAACASTLNMYCAYWAHELFSWHVISHDQIRLDIFYSLTTTPKSVHCKHPDLFRKFNKHLIVELGMCKNTYIGVWSFSTFRSVFSLRHTRHVVRHGHFTLKQLRLPILNEKHTNSCTGPRLK